MDQNPIDNPEEAPAGAQNADAGAPTGDAGPERRNSARRKLAAVTRLLRSEPLETLARELNVTVARLSKWRDRALVAAETAMKERERDSRDEELLRLKTKLRRGHHGQRTAGAEDCRPRGRPPFGPPEIEAVSRAISLATGRAYCLAKVARVWRLSRATVYRHRAAPDPAAPADPTPEARSAPALMPRSRARPRSDPRLAPAR